MIKDPNTCLNYQYNIQTTSRFGNHNLTCRSRMQTRREEISRVP